MDDATNWEYEFRHFNYTNRIFNDDGMKYKFNIDFYSASADAGWFVSSHCLQIYIASTNLKL